MTILLRPGPRYQQYATHRVKVALFDVDNTLVGDELPDLPSERFSAAVHAARGKIQVGVVSARPLAKVTHILDYIRAEGFSILCNGAQIVDNLTMSVVAEWPLALETCRVVLEYVKNLGVQYWVNDDGIDYFPSKTGFSYEIQNDVWDLGSMRTAVPEFVVRKPLVIVLHDIDDALVADITAFLPSCGDNSATVLIANMYKKSNGTVRYDLFVTHTRANKKDALYELVRLQKLRPENVMAVGDGRNDTALLEIVGVSVAMENAAPETLAVANFVAPNVEADGAAIALESALAGFADPNIANP